MKEKRDELTAAANGKALNAEHSGLDSSTQSFASLSSDEPALDTNAFATSNRRTPVGVRPNHPLKVSSNRRSKKKRFRADRVSVMENCKRSRDNHLFGLQKYG